MQTNSLFGVLLIGGLVIFFLYAIYSGRAQKKKPITTMTPEIKKPQSTVIETPKAEPVHLTSELKPQSTVIETPKKAEPSPLVKEEIKIEQIKSQSEKEVKEPALKTIDRGSKIIDIEGIGPVYAEKLNSINIYTTSDLLEAGAMPLGRKELAEKTGISHKLILEWVNIADLFRIKGVGEEYSDLLEEAGVDTVVELAKRVPENLHAKMLEVNEKKNLVNRPPPLSAVKDWVEQAKKLKRVVEY
jgi:predicted flap endonuclease-1-like 5' DNA nuclease